MALLLAESSIPPFMWAVVRLLAAEGKPLATDRARALLTPPSLTEGKENKAFDQALRTLRELKLIAEEKDPLSLAGHAGDLDGTDFPSFSSALRQAVLAGELNVGLADDAGQTGSRDLTRILVWFLSCDPLDGPATWAIVQREQSIDLNPDAGTASRNDTRWNRFVHCAGVGPGRSPLVAHQRRGPAAAGLHRGRQADGAKAVACRGTRQRRRRCPSLRTALPVLPGGDYANAMGISDPGAQSAGAALSYALLRGEDEGWLVLQQDADAQRVLTLHDPDRPSHYVSDIVISEDQHG